MYDDIDDLVKIHSLFVSGLEFFVSDFSVQAKKLRGIAVADDLADTFSETTLPRAKILYEHDWLTEEQMNLVLQIENLLTEMNKNKELWNDQAVKNALEWQKCREIGKELLLSLGY